MFFVKSTIRLRSLLRQMDIPYDSVSDEITFVYLPGKAIGYFGAEDPRNQSIHARVMPLAQDGSHITSATPRHTTWLSSEQAIEATIGGKLPEDDPRNFVSVPEDERMAFFGPQPKVPGLPIGADPDWVDWVAGLRHDEPRSLRDAIEQIAYDAICFGGDMGPNGNTWYGTDEGMVYTEETIDNWVRMVERLVGGNVT